MFDTLIRGATLLDGTGGAAYTADIGITDGRISAIGKLTDAARQTLDADGLHATPGFVDIHTHYDGQASWDQTFSPSIYHGVTTVVMGNCGVGFAPVQPGDEDRLVRLMEGVEEIPGAALAEGVRWGWRSFTDYARQLDAMPHTLDFMTLVPHDCLRLYVMGDRAAACEPATADDLQQMQALLRQALADGAVGFSTGRSDNHRTSRGEETPASVAAHDELQALGSVLRDLPYRVLHAVTDFDCDRGPAELQRQRFDDEYARLTGMARAASRPLAMTWLERLNAPQQWGWLDQAARASAEQGLDIRLQCGTRGIGVMSGLDTSFTVLMAFPGYQEIADLPVAERAAALRDPARRARILSEPAVRLARDGSSIPPIVDHLLSRIDQTAMLMFPLQNAQGRIDYEPDPRTSFGVKAKMSGQPALAVLYDYLAEGDGSNLIYFPIFNYLRGDLSSVQAMLEHPQALAALGDGGAHVGTICDASYSTTLLSHWGLRRQRGPRLPIEKLVQMLTQRNAAHMGLTDRGTLAVGQRADLNLLDLGQLDVRVPQLVRDLPAGGRRFVQQADGYRLTMVRGEVVCRDGHITDARPGRWLRAA